MVGCHRPPLRSPAMSLVKALLTAGLVLIGRWCVKNWELFLLRILPLAGAFFACADIAHQKAVTANAIALALFVAFFLVLRQFSALHQQAKANLESLGHCVLSVGRVVRRLLG
jgi:hypothetical protein